jgi:hypothetical protein
MVPSEAQAMISLSFGWSLDGLMIVVGIRMALKHFVSIGDQSFSLAIHEAGPPTVN